MAYCICFRRTLGIGSVEPFVVDKKLRRYIEIFGVEPLVVDKILRRYIVIGGIEPLLVDISRFFGVRGEVLCGKLLSVEVDMA